jgi:hypothetical protein
MAKAPRPGTKTATAQSADNAVAQQIMEITVRDETRRIAIGNIPLKEKLLVRKATGLAFENLLGDGDNIGEDSIIVLWWLAGRAEGNAFLTLDQVDAAWPRPLTENDLKVVLVDADESAGDDPLS